MQLLTDWITYESTRGPVSGYLARPAVGDGPLPGVVVLQEIWGVDAHIQDLTERFGAAGYVALAPDLYSAGEKPAPLAPPRIAAAKSFLDGLEPARMREVFTDLEARAQALAALPAEQGAAIGETMGALFGPARGDSATHLSIAAGGVAHLRADPACAGQLIGSVGYCLGGGLSLLLASSDPQLGAAVVYYGSAPQPEQVAAIRCPVRGFYGENDPRIIAGLAAFEESLTAAGVDHELRVYAGAGHAFFNDTRGSYARGAARDAWGETLAFLGRSLGAAPLS